MRRPAWNGSPPKNDAEARELLVAAATRCIAKDSLAHTSVASIAREAGVTRQTVYRYFDNGEQIVTEAELRAGGGILRGLREVAQRHATPSKKLIEAMVYLHREIPRDPLLGPYFFGETARLARDPIYTDVAIRFASANLQEVFGLARPTKAQRRALEELAELAVRILASLLQHPGAEPRTERALRTYLYDWLGPSIERAFGA